MAKSKSRKGKKSHAERMAWWREAKFGMFIHWGIYAVPAGVWKGKDIPGIGEWIQKRAQIPVKEYEQLAKKFNPVKFDADEWAQLAKCAGMRYMVLTSKHHDGFALFKSDASPYNIVDATPYGKDVIAALAKACKKAGIRLCFYYSHKQDWHHPDASGNTLDFPDESKKNFARYMREKALPQVRELLTKYGPIGLIWYDTPQDMTRAQSKKFRDAVLECQPDCLVDGRVGNDLGDYSCRGDNEIPPTVVEGDWETPATLNDTWGFKKKDKNWKPTKELIHLLVDIVSKGGNYLLNVGPTAEGIIPKASVKRLEEVGQWLKVNGEAIYGTTASPYPFELKWVSLTTKPGKLYLHVKEWPGKKLVFYGLKNKVKKARLLADKRQKINVVQEHDEAADLDVLRLAVPAKAPDKFVSVIALDIEGKPEMDAVLMQQPDGKIDLESHYGTITGPAGNARPRQARFGVVENWRNKQSRITWDFKAAQPGEYEVLVLCQAPQKDGLQDVGPLKRGFKARVTVGRSSTVGPLDGHEYVINPKAPRWHTDVVSKIGSVTIPKAGMNRLTFRLEARPKEKHPSLKLRAVQLIPKG